MSSHKFDVGDVVRIIGDESGSHNGELAEVIAVVNVDWAFDDVLEIRTFSGLCATVSKEIVQPVTLEEVQEHYADKPRRGFIVDGLTVDELESGQDEAYQTFRTAANEANREEEQRAAEENRKDRRALAELTVMSIMWVVFTFVSLAMWLVVMWTGETACAPIGYYSALVSVVAVVKPVYALILVCREKIKERRKRRKKGHGGEDPHNMG
jgi:cation transport ATPase